MTPESVTGSCGFRETLTHKKEKTGHSDAERERERGGDYVWPRHHKVCDSG